MFTRAAQGLRSLQRAWGQELKGCLQRHYSDAGNSTGGAASRLGQLQAESPQASKLFGNVGIPPEAEKAAAEAAEQAAAAASPPLENTAAMRVVSAIGNGLFFGSLGAAAFFGYYTYKYDNDQVAHMVEETKKEENAFMGSQLWVPVMEWYVGKRQYLEGELKKYADPPSDKLLPDLPPQARHIKTLVLDLDDVLVHSDWARERGWRTFKRAGADDFITRMSEYYELVVYTSQLPTYADPILDRLDPERRIQYRLYRDATQYRDGHHVRDLSKLNRDLTKVLFVTADLDACAMQPENAIQVRPWKLESGDTQLVDLIPFLEMVVRAGVPDVRDVVRSYKGQDIPTAFRERMKRIQEEQARKQQAQRGFLGGLAPR